jgi:hypothetical protein
MILDILRDAILANIGPLKSAPKNWSKRNCPLCHTQGHSKDTRHRFGIQFNPNSIAMNCFNCGFSAGYSEDKELSKSFKFFLKQISLDEEFIKKIEFEVFKKKNNISTIREGELVAIDIETKFKTLFSKWKAVELPADSMSITAWLDAGLDDPDFLRVANYALSRKLFNLDDFFWSPIHSHNLNERLIIPYYYKRKTVGFTARLCYDTDGKEIPKYYQQSPTDFVYNLDHQADWMRKYVIVNEGVLDAWATDGVGILGETNQAKIDVINRLQKEVIVCPDRDKKGWDLVKAAIDNNWSVSFPKWENGIKDASSASEKYGRLLTIHSIIASATSSKEKIELQWKIEQAERLKRSR